MVQFISKSTRDKLTSVVNLGTKQRSKVRAHLLCFPRASTTGSSSEPAEEFLVLLPIDWNLCPEDFSSRASSCDLFVSVSWKSGTRVSNSVSTCGGRRFPEIVDNFAVPVTSHVRRRALQVVIFFRKPLRSHGLLQLMVHWIHVKGGPFVLNELLAWILSVLH